MRRHPTPPTRPEQPIERREEFIQRREELIERHPAPALRARLIALGREMARIAAETPARARDIAARRAHVRPRAHDMAALAVETALLAEYTAPPRHEQTLLRGEEALLRNHEFLLRGEEPLLRGKEALLRRDEALLRGQKSLLRRDEALLRGDVPLLRGEQPPFRAAETPLGGNDALLRAEQTVLRGDDAPLERDMPSLRREADALRLDEAPLRSNEALLFHEMTRRSPKTTARRPRIASRSTKAIPLADPKDARFGETILRVRHTLIPRKWGGGTHVQSTQSTVLNTLQRVQRFMDANADALGTLNSSQYRTVVDDVVNTLGGHAVNQAASKRIGTAETAKQRVLRNALKLNHLRPIAAVAAAQLRQVPEFGALKMPQTNATSRRLIATAGAMAAAAKSYAKTFTDAGLPADFLAQLNTAAATLDTSIANRGQTTTNQTSATAGLNAEAVRGRQAVKVLDSLIEPQLAGNTVLLVQWKTAKRFGGKGTTVTGTTLDAATKGVAVDTAPASDPAPASAATPTPAPTPAPAPASAPAPTPPASDAAASGPAAPPAAA